MDMAAAPKTMKWRIIRWRDGSAAVCDPGGNAIFRSGGGPGAVLVCRVWALVHLGRWLRVNPPSRTA